MVPDPEDRISDLPEFLIQNIFAQLSTREIARTNILSKALLRARSSYPIIDFNQYDDPKYSGREFLQLRTGSEDECLFLKFVDAWIERFIDHELRMQRFKLSFCLIDEQSIPSMEKWTRVDVENSVEELELSIKSRSMCHELPPVVYSASSLKSLSLQNAVLYQQQLPSVKFTSITNLSLTNVVLDKQMLDCLFGVCPYIEYLSLDNSRGFRRQHLDMTKLKRLKEVLIKSLGFVDVDIDAENLENFVYFENFVYIPYKVNLKLMFSNLQNLSFAGIGITDGDLHELFSNLSRIEDLCLSGCNQLHKLKIVSHCLERLEINKCRNLKEADIEAPNLEQYKFLGNLNVSVKHISPKCTTSFVLEGDFNFQLWREFLYLLVQFDSSI